jgi:hypothetical protein
LVAGDGAEFAAVAAGPLVLGVLLGEPAEVGAGVGLGGDGVGLVLVGDHDVAQLAALRAHHARSVGLEVLVDLLVGDRGYPADDLGVELARGELALDLVLNQRQGEAQVATRCCVPAQTSNRRVQVRLTPPRSPSPQPSTWKCFRSSNGAKPVG